MISISRFLPLPYPDLTIHCEPQRRSNVEKKHMINVITSAVLAALLMAQVSAFVLPRHSRGLTPRSLARVVVAAADGDDSASSGSSSDSGPSPDEDPALNELYRERYPSSGGGSEQVPADSAARKVFYDRLYKGDEEALDQLGSVDWDAEWAKVVNGEQDGIQRKRPTTKAEQAWKRVKFETENVCDFVFRFVLFLGMGFIFSSFQF